MRVLYLADAPYPHTARWVEHFGRQGVECEVLSFRPAEIEGARVTYVAGYESLGKLRYLVHARRIARVIRSRQPDLVHALHLTSYGFLGALAGVRPLVTSVWGTDILEAPRLTPFHLWLTRFSLARADFLTATGLHLATETARYSPAGKAITVVPYGADLSRFQPRPQADRDEVVIGTVARISPEKGLRYLVEAFARLRGRIEGRVSLIIAGDTTPEPGGPDRARLERLANELGVADSVRFLGWVDPERLPDLLQSFDIFALPSVYEGFGVAAVEASAMALPVVASNIHGIPDVVRDGATGMLVPARDAGALAEALEILTKDAVLRRRLGEAGREFVAERYDWAKNAGQMERVYEVATGGRAMTVAAS